MSRPVAHEKVCLIAGMLSRFPELFSRAADTVSARFGKVSRESEILPFDFTDYYAPDMGEDLWRKFYAFERPIEPERLVEIKLWTNELEEKMAGADYPVARPINLDPGYVAASKLVLATTKDHAHRIYLARGIYAEVTLSFVEKEFRPMPWTYPDYRTGPYRRFFEAVRADWASRRPQQRE